MLCGVAAAEENAPLTVRLIQPEETKLMIPDDVILVPYDSANLPDGELPTAESLRSPQQRVFVSSERFRELFDLVHNPEKRAPKKDFLPKTPVAYAMAGAEYHATLVTTTTAALQENLLIEGTIRFEVFSDEPLAVPFPVSGGVLESVTINGKKAELGFSGTLANAGVDRSVRVETNPGQRVMIAQNLYEAPETEMGQAAIYLLSVQGKGEYVLEWKSRYNVRRQGGWHIVSGRLPAGPTRTAGMATSVTLTIPEIGSELRTGNELDQRKWISSTGNNIVETTLAPGGVFHWQWRPQVTEGTVDDDLKIDSDALFEVREDGMRMTWNLTLDFGGGKHETFRLRLPGDYQVAAIDGRNVRGWGPVEIDIPDSDKQTIDVELLKPADTQELVTVVMWKNRGTDDAANDIVPVVEVVGAAMHRGRMSVMQSPLLNVRTIHESGLSRTDLPSANELTRIASTKLAGLESPLGIRPVQTFRFASESFRLALDVSPVVPLHSVTIQSIVNMSEYETTLESNITLQPDKKPIYQADIRLPQGFKVRRVNIPIRHEYIVHTVDEKLILSVYFPEGSGSRIGAAGNVQIVVEGELPERETISLPKISVSDIHAASIMMYYAVLTDPAFDVRLTAMSGCDTVPAETLTWLSAARKPLARLALRANNSRDFGGTLSLVQRQPDVVVSTISNTSIKRQSIEETILIDYTIERAGIRRVEFELPQWLENARIETPLLQRKTVTPTENGNVHVRLDLQEEMMGELQVLVRSDRPLVAGADTPVAIPVMHTGRVQRQYVVLESREGIDEITASPSGLRLLTRGTNDWAHLESILGSNFGTGYIAENVRAGLALAQGDREGTPLHPALTFQTHRRETLRMAGVSVGLAETRIVVGEEGAYIAEQVYHVDNKTEQYLDLWLPHGAELWVVRILTAAEWKQRERRNVNDAAQNGLEVGEPVKPTQMPEEDRNDFIRTSTSRTMAKSTGTFVRIPLVRTEPGDPDYALRLIYAGTLPPVRPFARIAFPLIVVKRNIHIESSIVRLHLPHGFRYTFDGTLTLVERQKAEQSVVALKKSHDQNVMTRLESSAQQFANSFEQSRAISNLGEIYGVQEESLITLGKRKVMDRENESVARGDAVYNDGGAIYNDGKIEHRFSNQSNTMARGNSAQLISNWAVDPSENSMKEQSRIQRGLQEPTGSFKNNEWLASNQLVRRDEPSKTTENLSMGRMSMDGISDDQQVLARRISELADSRFDSIEHRQQAQSPQAPQRPAVTLPPAPVPIEQPQVADVPQQRPQTRFAPSPGSGQTVPPHGAPMPPGQSGGRGGMGGGNFGGVSGGVVDWSNPQQESPHVVLSDLDVVILEAKAEDVAKFESIIKNLETISPLATRFASLDIDIPLGGQEYVFTSPRGEGELRARCYAESYVTRSAYLFFSLLVITAAVGIERFTRKRRGNPT